MSLVSTADFIDLIRQEQNEGRFNCENQGLCFNFSMFEVLIFGDEGGLYIFKKSKNSEHWSLIKDYSHSWDSGEINHVFENRMEVISKISIVDVEICNKEITKLTKKNELATFETLCDKISHSRHNGVFGWTDDMEYIKGTVFEFDGLQILAYASSSYITIASKQDGEEEWNFHTCHTTCWRQDGVCSLMRQSREIVTERPVLVTPTSDRTVGQVIYQ